MAPSSTPPKPSNVACADRAGNLLIFHILNLRSSPPPRPAKRGRDALLSLLFSPQARRPTGGDYAGMPSFHVEFTRLAEGIGIDAALTLVAFCDGAPTLYIPGFYRAGHILERVLGDAGFLHLIASFGGETICMPRLNLDAERRIGAVYRGMKAGQSTRKIADGLGISYRRVRQIEVAIKSGQPLTTTARARC